MRKKLLAVSILVTLSAAARGQGYESSFGIQAIPGHIQMGRPVNFQFSYDFSHGLESLGGTWRAWAGGAEGDGASVTLGAGLGEEDPAALFHFDLPPGGDTWALLAFQPGRFSNIRLGPADGFFFRARTERFEMDGWPARWFVQIRVADGKGGWRTLRSPDIEILNIWRTYYASTWDFEDSEGRGLFAGGEEGFVLHDVSFIPNTSKYRRDDFVVDAFMVYGPGRKLPGVDTDGDGIPDLVDGDDDNDGIHDFAQGRPDAPLVFRREGYVQGGGRWEGRFTLSRRALKPGDTLEVEAALRVASPEIACAIDQIPELVALLVGERRFDKAGRWHSFSNHMISSVLTPAGLPIENYQNLVPSRHVTPTDTMPYTSPIDAVCRVPRPEVRKGLDEIFVTFTFQVPLPADTPEGHYWLYFEFGLTDRGGTFQRLDSFPFEARRSGVGLSKEYLARDENLVFEKKTLLPMVRVGKPAVPRFPWALLMDQEVHGVRGIVPDEEQGFWALNARNRLRSRPIYPPGRYNLEPGLPSMALLAINFPFPANPRSGALSVRVTGPDGKTVDLGTAPFRALTTWGATTRTGRFFHDFTECGAYVVRATGWFLDAHGNRYEGGGTYRLWIARRITFGTFPSLPYTVGQGFHSAVEVVPNVEADVTLTVEFFPQSDVARKEVFEVSGKANRLGLFVAPETYVFKEPGEYLSRIEATYTASDGTLWLGSLHGSMVVAEEDSPLVVHGRTGTMRDGLVLPTESRFDLEEEGSAETGITQFLFYPDLRGDVMYIASSMDHHNFIYPLLTMAFTDDFNPYGGTRGDRLAYSVFSTSANGWQPFAFPEQRSRIAYYYADAWRPGVSGRHLVASGQVMNSYWATSPSVLGRQMHAGGNGDLPGDFYRFTGGVVYRDVVTGENRYGIYAAMGVLTEKGTKRNRVSAPCSEPLFVLDGREHTLFLGGGVLPVPGMILLEGSRAPAGGAANPPVPAALETVVTAPSGKQFTYALQANAIGVFPRTAGSFTALTEPGVWRARQKLTYNGATGDVLGTRDGSYVFFVAPADPARHFELALDAPPVFRIAPGAPVILAGMLPDGLTEGTLHVSTVSPGLVLEEGRFQVEEGRFAYVFDPWETGRRIPFYDTVNALTGRPELSDTVVFNLFFEGKTADGKTLYGSRVVVMRGDTVIAESPK